ncbi:MAG TPA: kynureninase, partial [Acidimicrobiia bacterium]|nr:kynureninase [Acidimicrobiia bacterium]
AGVVYLDGNSLGAMPAHVPARIEEVVGVQWGTDLIRSWNVHGWVDLPRRVGDRIAGLIGVAPGSVIACDSTSVNLHKAVSAALAQTERRVILSDTGNFPTDLYVMANLAELRLVDAQAVPQSIDDDVGVVALTHVGYGTGRMHDMRAVTEAAHAAGALMVWDLAHSAGAMDLDLGDTDLAVGCGYKYLNGGPGAPAFIYVRPDRLGSFVNPITGWFGHAAPFDFDLEFVPADGITRAQVGTPSVLALAALDAALDVFEGVDLAELRAKSLSLSDLFIRLVDQLALPLDLITPRERESRGSQVCYSHPDGYAIVQALIDRRVIGDFRTPDVLRFGFAPLYVSYTDVWDAVHVIADVLATQAHLDPRYAVRGKVT